MTDHLTYSLPVPGPVKGCTRPQGQARDTKPLLLEFYIYIAVLASDLRTVSIYSVMKFLYNSSTIKLLLLLILINGYI